MNVFNKLKDNISQAHFYINLQKHEIVNEVKSYIGSVFDFTPFMKYLEESKKMYKENVEESPNILVQQRWGFLGFISTINKCALFVLEQVKDQFDKDKIKEAIKGFSIAECVISIISLIELKELYSDIKEFPAQLKEAVKTSEIAKTVLAGIGLLSRTVKVPIVIHETFAPLVDWIGNIDLGEIFKFDKWAPSLGGISLVLSTAFTALKIWDLYDTYKFADKMKEKCCLELIRNLEEDLKEEFKGNKPLLVKLDLALALDKGKRLKKLHKKELAFQKELSKKKPDPEILLKALEDINLQDEKNQKIVEHLRDTISLYRLNDSLSNPVFKRDILDKTSLLIGDTYKEMKSQLKKGENIDLKLLKKEIKSSATRLNPELMDKVNRSAKLAYLNILSEYNTKKLKSIYQVEGDLVQTSAKKTIALANSLFNRQEFRAGDEKVAIAYKELKGRVKHKKFSTKISLTLNAINIASASIALAGPTAPAGIALAVLAGAAGFLNACYNTYKTIKFQENMGITEIKLINKFQKKLNEFGDEHIFVQGLSTNQQELLDLIRNRVKDEDFSSIIHFKFTVPKTDRRSGEDERSKRLAAKQMNRLIESMNAWSEKKMRIQENLIVKHCSSQLKKIDPKALSTRHLENLYSNLEYMIDAKNFHKLNSLRKVAVNENWSPEEKAAALELNNIIDSMHEISKKRHQRHVDELEVRSKILKTRSAQESTTNQ